MINEISDVALNSWYARDYDGFYGRDDRYDTDPYGRDVKDDEEEEDE